MREPRVSSAVIVTVKDDAAALARLLESLEQQRVQPTEVCLVIAASADTSLTIAQSWNPSGINVLVLPVSAETTRSQARNLGVEATHADVIVFTDAGCVADNSWLEKLLLPFSLGQHVVSGLTLPEVHSPWDEAQARFVLVSPEQIPAHPLPATRNMALTRELWLFSGGFHPQLNFAEDFAFARKLLEQGYPALFQPEAVVYWRPRPTFKSFFLMIQRLTAGDIQAGIFRPGLISMWLRYLFFLASFLVFVLNVGWGRGVLGFITLLFFYVLLKQKRWKDLSIHARVWAFPLQITSDLAVLSGSVLGLVWRQRTRENTGR